MKLPACHSRREVSSRDRRFFCAHPQVHAPDGLVTPEVCRICPYWRMPAPTEFRPYPPPSAPQSASGISKEQWNEPCFYLGEETGLRDCDSCQGTVKLKVFACRHPLHDETTRQECRTCQDFERRLQPRSIRSWAVGVTTAPRTKPTLERTLRSLTVAGWSDVRLFAEPASPIPADFSHLPVTLRDEPLGAWPNFFLALSELTLRAPHADAYFLLQDDAVFCQNLRQYLEQSLWPAETVAVVSAYCPSTYATDTSGWRAVDAGQSLISAVTCIFPNAAARSLLGFARALNHRRRGPFEGLKGVDSVIGAWARESGLPVYFHSPSLALHTGETSVTWPALSAHGRRQAKDFVGENFDAGCYLASAEDNRRSVEPPSTSI